MLCEHGNVSPCVECDIEPLRAENEALQAECGRLKHLLAEIEEAEAMNDSRETHTLDENGTALTTERDGHSAPADYSFECVNAYVHAHDRHFEELQWLALGMADEIEKLTKALTALLDALDSSRSLQYKALREAGRKVTAKAIEPTCKRDKKPCGEHGYCLECPSGPGREWLSK